jgi:hypothetical protein
MKSVIISVVILYNYIHNSSVTTRRTFTVSFKPSSVDVYIDTFVNLHTLFLANVNINNTQINDNCLIALQFKVYILYLCPI